MLALVFRPFEEKLFGTIVDLFGCPKPPSSKNCVASMASRHTWLDLVFLHRKTSHVTPLFGRPNPPSSKNCVASHGLEAPHRRLTPSRHYTGGPMASRHTCLDLVFLRRKLEISSERLVFRRKPICGSHSAAAYRFPCQFTDDEGHHTRSFPTKSSENWCHSIYSVSFRRDWPGRRGW